MNKPLCAYLVGDPNVLFVSSILSIIELNNVLLLLSDNIILFFLKYHFYQR